MWTYNHYKKMKKRFEVILLDEALDFIYDLDDKTSEKILYNINKATYHNDPELFKKLTFKIWEFRTHYQGIQYRLFAFWDKTDKTETLVLSTHGMVKKISKVPKSEIEKALIIVGIVH